MQKSWLHIFTIQHSEVLFLADKVYVTQLMCKELDMQLLLIKDIYECEALYHPERQSCCFQSALLHVCMSTCSLDYFVRLYCLSITGNWKYWNGDLGLKMCSDKDFKEKIETISIITHGTSYRYYPELWKKMGAVIFVCIALVQNGNRLSWQAKKFFPLRSLGTHLHNCLSLTHMPLYLLCMPIPDLYS